MENIIFKQFKFGEVNQKQQKQGVKVNANDP